MPPWSRILPCCTHIFIICDETCLVFCPVDPNIFPTLVNLEGLYLDHNRLMYIHPSALPPVRKLHLDENNLTHIPNFLTDVDIKGYVCEKFMRCCEYHVIKILECFFHSLIVRFQSQIHIAWPIYFFLSYFLKCTCL